RSDSFGENPVLGTVFGLIDALMYSGYLLALRHSNQAQAPAAGSLFDATLGAAVTCLLAGPIVGGLDLVPAWPSHGWLLVLALGPQRSEEHTSELQSRENLVCRLLLEKKKRRRGYGCSAIR